MLEIIHNARCSKSRNCYQISEQNGEEFKVREYLKDPLTKEELKSILTKLNISAEALVRKGEADYKENYKDKNLTEEEWIDAMVKYPKLIQRPIVIKGDKAVIGRPESAIEDLLKA